MTKAAISESKSKLSHKPQSKKPLSVVKTIDLDNSSKKSKRLNREPISLSKHSSSTRRKHSKHNMSNSRAIDEQNEEVERYLETINKEMDMPQHRKRKLMKKKNKKTYNDDFDLVSQRGSLKDNAIDIMSKESQSKNEDKEENNKQMTPDAVSQHISLKDNESRVSEHLHNQGRQSYIDILSDDESTEMKINKVIRELNLNEKSQASGTRRLEKKEDSTEKRNNSGVKNSKSIKTAGKNSPHVNLSYQADETESHNITVKMPSKNKLSVVATKEQYTEPSKVGDLDKKSGELQDNDNEDDEICIVENAKAVQSKNKFKAVAGNPSTSKRSITLKNSDFPKIEAQYPEIATLAAAPNDTTAKDKKLVKDYIQALTLVFSTQRQVVEELLDKYSNDEQRVRDHLIAENLAKLLRVV